MPDFPLLQGVTKSDTFAEVTGSSRGTGVQSASGANNKGNYIELVASTAFDAGAIEIHAMPGVSNDTLLDIATGGSGVEVNIIDNLLCCMFRAGGDGVKYYLPLHIPLGSRITARIQTAGAGSLTQYIHATIFPNSYRLSSPLQGVVTYGANTADSGGSSVDPGGVAHTKGAWTQLTASTTKPVKQLIMALGKANNTTLTDSTWLIDIGIGASGSETVVIGDLGASATTTSDVIAPCIFGPYPVNIPAGTRVAVRAQALITDATDRLLDVCLYALY